MENKKKLLYLLDLIKAESGFTDKEISRKSGYLSDYVTVSLSTGKVSKKLISKIELKFASELERAGYNSNIVEEPEISFDRRKKPNERVLIKDAMARIFESQHRVEARQMVIRNFLAEIYAKVYNQPSSKVLGEMEEMENKAAAKLRDQLKLR